MGPTSQGHAWKERGAVSHRRSCQVDHRMTAQAALDFRFQAEEIRYLLPRDR